MVLGSVACRAMGIPATPKDLDIIYRASAENISRLSTALQPIAIDFVDFEGLGEVDLSPELLSKSSPLALLTSFGRIDLIQEIAGIRYEDVEFSCAVVNLEGREMRCVSIEIETYLRQIAGREKDQPVLEKLNRVRDAALGSAGSVTARAEPEAPTSAD